MRISELERVLREGIKANPGRPALALLTGGGASVPTEFAEAARALASRSHKASRDDSILRAKDHDGWF
jgi:hypothetical protein